MKILLIQPAKPKKALGGEDFSIFEPLALEYLAAGVALDHDVRILDMRLDPDLDSHLRNFQPDVAGITAYTVHVNTVNRLFQRIKAFNPETYTIVGGHHATIRPEDFYTPFIDLLISGEGVLPFREAVVRLEKGKALSEIPRAVCLENGAILLEQEDHGLDLDELPFPRRDLTATYRRSYFSEWMRPLASIRTSKGCHFRCQYCALWKLTGGRYLARKPACIMEELGTIQEDYVFFADDESLLDTARMKVLAGLIQESGLKKHFFLYGRSDTIAQHADLLEEWKKAGLERVFVGLEFMRDADLKAVRKGSTVENNERAVHLLKDLDIDIWPMFMIRPEFDRRDFADLQQYCLGLDLDFIGFSVLTPLPGTDLYDEVRDRLINANFDYFDFFHTLLPTKLPLQDFYIELTLLFKRSRSLRNQIRLMRKYRLQELPSLFKAYGTLMRRLQTLAQDYPV